LKCTSICRGIIHSVPTDNILKTASPSALRGHDRKLLKRHCNSQLRLQSFSFRARVFMEQEVVVAPSLNAFKGKHDKFWKNYKYTVDPEIFMGRRQVISQMVQSA